MCVVIIVVDIIAERVDLLRTLTGEYQLAGMREDLNAAGCVIKLLAAASGKEHLSCRGDHAGLKKSDKEM